MAPKLIIFTGAPAADSLSWDESGLLTDFEPQIARFAGLHCLDQTTADDDEVIPATHPSSYTEVGAPKWRALPLKRQHLPTGLSQSFDHHVFFNGYSHQDSLVGDLSQIPASRQSSIVSAGEVLSQFYEESYARHEDVISSQIAPASVMSNSFTSDEFSYDTSSFMSSFGQAPDIPPYAGHLANIKDIPNAAYLDSIQPQTMTVNLIVGVISIPSPRPIRTKRNADVELVEVLVGDETKSGFGINFWLPSVSQSDMKTALSGLRPQDVVLMRNVALSSFKGKVYGQSLRREMTKVHLLYRNKVDRNDLGGCYTARDLKSEERGNAQVEKTKRVRVWVSKFVGVGIVNHRPSGKRDGTLEAAKEVLPPDTQ